MSFELQTAAFGLGITLILLAVAILLYAGNQRGRSGLPDGKVIYSDSGTWHTQKKTFLDRQLGLVGKPDYLVEQNDGHIIPVEVKSKKAPHTPHESHIMQLAAYCALVEATYQIRPTHGIIQYSDRAFAVDYTPELEEELLYTLADMRADRQAYDLDRDHDEWQRCAHCSLRHHCDQRLDLEP